MCSSILLLHPILLQELAKFHPQAWCGSQFRLPNNFPSSFLACHCCQWLDTKHDILLHWIWKKFFKPFFLELIVLWQNFFVLHKFVLGWNRRRCVFQQNTNLCICVLWKCYTDLSILGCFGTNNITLHIYCKG